MHSVLGNHKTMTHQCTMNVIHVYRELIVFTQQVHNTFYQAVLKITQNFFYTTDFCRTAKNYNLRNPNHSITMNSFFNEHS